MGRVRQHQFEVAVAEDVPYRLPVDSGRLHRHVSAARFREPSQQRQKPRRRRIERPGTRGSPYRPPPSAHRRRPSPCERRDRRSVNALHPSSLLHAVAVGVGTSQGKGTLINELRGVAALGSNGVIEGARVQLTNGLFRTIEKPTSLPTAATECPNAKSNPAVTKGSYAVGWRLENSCTSEIKAGERRP